MDHFTSDDFTLALQELKRITKSNGLIYLSFDPLEESDQSDSHDILADGSFLYTDGENAGLLFHYYSDMALTDFLKEEETLTLYTDARGNRHVILRNR